MTEDTAEIQRNTGGISLRLQFGKGFLSKYFVGPLQQAAGMLEDHLRVTRWERRQRLVERVEAFANKKGMTKPTREIPAKIFVPLVQAAVTEDDDELQDLWARMLINAADADNRIEARRAYTTILQDCTRLDIRILAALYNVPPKLRGESFRSKSLPNQAKLADQDTHAGDHSPAPETLRSLWNLHRLGLIAPDTALAAGDQEMVNVRITALGVGLVEICTLNTA